MSAPMNVQDLNAMKRADLQKLCKDYNIKANLKTDQIIIELLSKQIREDELAQKLGASAPARPPSTLRTVPAPKIRRSLSQPTLGSSTNLNPAIVSKLQPSVTKPPLNIPRRPISALSKNDSVKTGKENGNGIVPPTRVMKTSSGPVPSTAASKPSIGRIAVFGRSTSSTKTTEPTGASSNVRKPPISYKPPPTKRAPTPLEPEQPRPSSSAELDILRSQVTALQETSITLQMACTAFESRLDAKDEEVRRLQEDLEGSRLKVGERASENEELRTQVHRLEGRLEEVQALFVASKESETDSARRILELEKALERLSNQVQASRVQPTPPPAGPYAFEPSPYVELARAHQYLDLELHGTPSTKRRVRDMRAEIGRDALQRYDGFGRVSIDGETSPRWS